MDYNNDFRYDLKVGQVAERQLGEMLDNAKIEVKRDLRASRTKKVFVEFFCRGKPSGISTTEADYWAFMVSDKVVVILPTEKLKGLVEEAIENGKAISGGDRNTSQGVLISIERLLQ